MTTLASLSPAEVRALGGLVVSCAGANETVLGMRALSWYNSLLRLGLRVPFVVVHDLGAALLGAASSIRVPADLPPNFAAPHATAQAALGVLGQYAQVLEEIAKTDIAAQLAATRIDDSVLATLLARAIGPVADRWRSSIAFEPVPMNADALTQAATGLYNLVILDWMLPDMDGLSVVRELRRRGVQVPVMMLTARGEVSEKVLALDAGADDFVVKPFEVEELAARVRALLRRAVGARRLDLGPLRVDFTERKASLDGALLDLTSKEYALLLHLAHRIDRVVSRTELLAQVWGSSFDPGSNLVDVHVSRLREKLGDAAWMIETQRGVGYRLRTERGA